MFAVLLFTSCTTVYHENGQKALDLAGNAKVAEFRTGKVELRVTDYQSPIIKFLDAMTFGIVSSMFGL